MCDTHRHLTQADIFGLKRTDDTMRLERAGFTLIELLVVIAIIAILAAILFPVFASAKERENVTKCIVNLKQLSQAVRQYCDDNNGIMPFCYEEGPDKPDWSGCEVCGQPFDVSNGGLFRYVRNKAVYRCPSE